MLAEGTKAYYSRPKKQTFVPSASYKRVLKSALEFKFILRQLELIPLEAASRMQRSPPAYQSHARTHRPEKPESSRRFPALEVVRDSPVVPFDPAAK